MDTNQYKLKKNAEEMKYQLISFSLMIFFTILSFSSILLELPSYFVSPFIFLLAIVQIIFQLYYFMHLKDKGNNLIQFFLLGSISISFVIILAFTTIIWN